MQPGAIITKVEGVKQAALLNSMSGQSFTVAPLNPANTGLESWLFLNPTGSASSQGPIALKLEGARQTAELSGLVGKTVTIGKAPLVAGGGMGKWLVLHPSLGASAGGGTGMGIAANGLAPVVMKTVAITAAPGAAATAGKSIVAGAAAKSAVGGGLGLGLGLGLGSLGPVILACLAGAASYGLYKWYKNRGASNDSDEIAETL